jgi:hypothetical protein
MTKAKDFLKYIFIKIAYLEKEKYLMNLQDERYTVFEISEVPPYHLLLDSAPNLGPLISRWEIKKFVNC